MKTGVRSNLGAMGDRLSRHGIFRAFFEWDQHRVEAITAVAHVGEVVFVVTSEAAHIVS